MKYLILDSTNILWRTFYANRSEDDTTIAGLALHAGLVTVNKYFKQHKPSKTIMCFDRHSWRKEYTASDKCVSKKPYKGNRRKKMSPSEQEKYERFLEHLEEFEQLITVRTSIVALANDGLEADDLIAGTVQELADGINECIIISGDKDMIQLLKYPNVTLIDPASGKARTLQDWNDDAELFMFEKCIRGDLGDNVQSAYPRVRKTRILKAYQDPYEHANLMMEQWTDQNGIDYTVKDLFKENVMLMDLDRQPDDIKQKIKETVVSGIENPGYYSYFHFMKFLGKYQLKKLASQVELFVPLLSS